MKVRLAIICTSGHWEWQAPQSKEKIHEVLVEIPLEPGWEVQRVMVCEPGGDDVSIQDRGELCKQCTWGSNHISCWEHDAYGECPGFSNAECGLCGVYPCECHMEEQ